MLPGQEPNLKLGGDNTVRPTFGNRISQIPSPFPASVAHLSDTWSQLDTKCQCAAGLDNHIPAHGPLVTMVPEELITWPELPPAKRQSFNIPCQQ
jgi:hypothetical protein